MKKMLSLLLFVGLLLGLGVRGSGDEDAVYPEYEALFTHGNLHEVEIVMTREEWEGLIQDMKDYAADDPMGWPRTGNYRKATFIYKGAVGDTTIEEVGFRTKGNVSRVIPQDDEGAFHRTHFKVKFNKRFDQEEGTPEYEERRARRFCTLATLNFRWHMSGSASEGMVVDEDVSQIRELYCYDLLNKAGIYTSRTGSARLTITIDGDKHYFGIYTITEPFDKRFLTKRYGRDRNDGNLYKCLFGDSGPASLEPVDDPVNLIFREERIIGVEDWESHYRPTYDLKTNEDEADHTELLDFIDNLNALSGADLKEYLDNNFLVDRFLKYQAMNVLLGKWDDYWAVGNNYYLYFNNDGKIEFITFDYDMALGGGMQLFDTASVGIYEWSNHVNELTAISSGLPLSFVERVLDYHSPLVEKMFEIAEYRDTYEAYLAEFITPANELFIYSEYEKKFNEMYDLYSPYLDNDVGEGEEMRNEESTREYFYEKTRSIIYQLGLTEDDYELKPVSLNAPTGVSATDGSYPDVIAVTWDPVSYADYYQVYRAGSVNGTYVLVGEAITETSFNDESVAIDSDYFYKVKAVTNDGVESAFSPSEAGSTNDGTIITPTGISATDGMYSHMIAVKWDSVLNADYYAVYRSDTASGTYVQVGENVSETGFNDKSMVLDATYYYKVKAFTNEGAETDFSAEDTGFASDTGLSAPEIISAAVLVSGTYSHSDDTGTTTYIFDDDSICRKSMPSPPEAPAGGNVRSQGDWNYDEDGEILTIATSSSFAGGLLTVRVTEVWENAFTIDRGSTFYLMGLRKTTGGQDTVVGKYKGKGSINVVITGLGMDDDYVEIIEGEVAIKDDGTWESIIVGIGGARETASGTWSNDDNKLIEFGGSYYLHQSEEAVIFTRISCPLSLILGNEEGIDTLRDVRDYRLQNSGSDLVTMYYSNAAEVASILSENPALKSQLRDVVMENMDTAGELLKGGSVTVNRNVIEEGVAFLYELERVAGPRLRKDIDSIIAGIEGGDLLRELNVRVD